MKRAIKRVLFAVPGAESSLRALKTWWRTTRTGITSHAYDYRTNTRYLTWARKPGTYWPLSSELIFQYHKLEKGLCLPPETRRFYGAEAARETCRLLREWSQGTAGKDAPIYRAATETLRAWRKRFDETPPAPGQHDDLVREIDALLATMPQDMARHTPIANRAAAADALDHFHNLMLSRRSTRDFDGRPVDFALVEKAVTTAQLSPSACNRQPWHLHFYDDPTAISAMLTLQNGNAGFGQTVPLLAVMTSDLSSFFDASERTEPALDGGLFLMSFLLALQAQGLSTCCLNWCVLPDKDRRAHVIGQIPASEKILTFLAIGKAQERAVVPLSARRSIADVIRRHSGLCPPEQP